MKQITTIGLDLAKQVFQIHGADAEGSPIVNRKLRRAEVLRFFEKQPACLVGIEACGSSHYWAREIAALGHEVRLIPPAYVRSTARLLGVRADIFPDMAHGMMLEPGWEVVASRIYAWIEGQGL